MQEERQEEAGDPAWKCTFAEKPGLVFQLNGLEEAQTQE